MSFFNKLKKKVDFAYFSSFILIIFSICSNLTSEYLMRKVIATKANIAISPETSLLVPVDLSILLLIKFFVITSLLFLILVISKNSLRLYSLKANIFRGTVVILAGYIWSKAVDMTAMEIPIYMTSLVALSVPIFVAIFSKLLLREKTTVQRLAIIAISALTLFLILLKYILSGFYPISIIMLVVACILYSFSDTLNIAIINAKSEKEEKNLFLRAATRESIGAQIFYTNLFATLFTIVFIFIRGYFGFFDLHLQIRSVQSIFHIRWVELFLIGFFSTLMSSFSLFGFKLKPGSSVQYIKILEPIMAGSFSLISEMPLDILFTIMILFLLSIINFLMEVQYRDKL